MVTHASVSAHGVPTDTARISTPWVRRGLLDGPVARGAGGPRPPDRPRFSKIRFYSLKTKLQVIAVERRS